MNDVTILLVEDDPNDAILLGFAFRENPLPLHLREVCDGHAAVAYLKGEGRYSDRTTYPLPGLVVLDLHPSRFGRSVLRWIRKQPRLAGLPVVMFNGREPQIGNEATLSDTETVTITRRDAKDLIHLLKNANLDWAANAERITESSSSRVAFPRCASKSNLSRSGRICGERRALRPLGYSPIDQQPIR